MSISPAKPTGKRIGPIVYRTLLAQTLPPDTILSMAKQPNRIESPKLQHATVSRCGQAAQCDCNGATQCSTPNRTMAKSRTCNGFDLVTPTRAFQTSTNDRSNAMRKARVKPTSQEWLDGSMVAVVQSTCTRTRTQPTMTAQLEAISQSRTVLVADMLARSLIVVKCNFGILHISAV
jgi:hypothetical protein